MTSRYAFYVNRSKPPKSVTPKNSRAFVVLNVLFGWLKSGWSRRRISRRLFATKRRSLVRLMDAQCLMTSAIRGSDHFFRPHLQDFYNMLRGVTRFEFLIAFAT